MSELEGMINSLISNPDDMKKIMEMASSFMAGSDAAPSESAPPPPPPKAQSTPDLSSLFGGDSTITPEMGAAAMKLMKGFGGKGNEKSALLAAMKPYLSESRRTKLDKAVQLARVLNVGLGLFSKDGSLLGK